MIEMIASFFQSLGQFFTTVWGIVTNIAEKIADLFKMAVQSIKFALDIIGVFPPIFVVVGVATIIVLIVYLILGRESGN